MSKDDPTTPMDAGYCQTCMFGHQPASSDPCALCNKDGSEWKSCGKVGPRPPAALEGMLNVECAVDSVIKAMAQATEGGMPERDELRKVVTEAMLKGLGFALPRRPWYVIENEQLTEALEAALDYENENVEISHGAVAASDRDGSHWAARVALGEYVKRGGPKPPPDNEIKVSPPRPKRRKGE